VISSKSCRHTITRIAIEAQPTAFLFGTHHNVNVPQHTATSVGHIVLSLRWAVDGMVRFHV
jgi:hypothetical protein